VRRLLAALALTSLLLGGCSSYNYGTNYIDRNLLNPRPDAPRGVRPVAKVEETLFGVHLFGLRLATPDPEELKDRHLTKPSYGITNWQVVAGTAGFPLGLLDWLINWPWARVNFDVVELLEEE